MNNIVFYIAFFLIFLILPTYTLFIVKKKNTYRPISLKKQIFNHLFTINIFITLITVIYIIYFLKTGTLLIRNKNIENVLQNSHLVSEAYYKEGKEKINNDIMIIARTLSDQSDRFFSNKEQIQILIENYSTLKELNEIVVFCPSENIILARNLLGFSLIFDSISSSFIFKASKTNAIIIEDLQLSKIKALIELDGFPTRTYLMISRSLDKKITDYILQSKDALNSYDLIKKDVNKVQNIFLSVFIITVLISIIFIFFITKIIGDQSINPINEFVSLTSKQDIENFDFLAIKNKKTNILELNILINAFGLIIEKLNQSREEIAEYNSFINSIFSQTPYGLFVINKINSVIVMENEATNKILLHNKENENLSLNLKNLFIQKIQELIIHKPCNIIEKSFDLTEIHSGKMYNFLVKIIKANFNYLDKKYHDHGDYFLVMFNEITDHIALQRNKLWIDVARRITHEIRNPLTPILLSVERIQSKFTSICSNQKDIDLISKYLGNIKRHTAAISLIIDKFIEFGKMPDPEFHKANIINIINDAIDGSYFNQSMKYEFDISSYSIQINKDLIENFICDEKQITRMLLNIFKNSFEAFNSSSEKKDLIIKIKIFFDEMNYFNIIINDNGPGFPLNLIRNLTEPYITTKKDGAGLGLSIVKRIINDHNAKIIFENILDSNKEYNIGAKIHIIFLKKHNFIENKI